MPNLIKSICRHCVFANWNGKRQMGCTFNRVYKFARRGVEVIRAYDENEMEFFIINGRICNRYRDLMWYNNNHSKNLKKIVKEEGYINYSLFLTFKESNIDDLLFAINSLDIPPTKLFIINRSGQDISKRLLKGYSKQWEVLNIVNEEKDDWHIDKHIMSKRVRSLLYFHLDESELGMLPRILYKINYIVNEELVPVEGLVYNDRNIGGLLLMHEVYGKEFFKEIKNPNHIIKL